MEEQANLHDSPDDSGKGAIALLVERRYLSQQQPSGMLSVLRASGLPVRVIDPEADAYQFGEHAWLSGIDLMVCRGRSVALQLLVGWAESREIPCINRREAIAAVFNKAEMTASLSSAGISIPRTFLGPPHELANRLPIDAYPVVLKPVYGDNCRGLKIVRSDNEMADTNWPEPVALAQRFHATDGFDLKLYGIGRNVWAVRKPSCLAAALKESDSSETAAPAIPYPVPLTRDMETLARRCADLFGLELFGVDCIETPEGILVIEVNDFPNYSGVDGANETLAEYVIRAARPGKAGIRR